MRTRSEGETQRESRWREIVAGQRQSGQSVRAYCRQAGVEKSAFYWWRRELARRSTPLRVQQRNDPLPARRVIRPVKPTRPGARRPSGAAGRVGFLPVQLAARCVVRWPGRRGRSGYQPAPIAIRFATCFQEPSPAWPWSDSREDPVRGSRP